FGAGEHAEFRHRIVGRVEAVGGGVLQPHDRGFGAGVEAAVLDPDRLVVAACVNLFDAAALRLVVALGLAAACGDSLAGHHVVQLLRDLRVVGGEQLVERAAAWGGGLVNVGVAFAGIVPCVVGGRRRNRLGLAFDRLLLLVLWLLLRQRKRDGLTAFADHARAYAARCPGTIMMPDAQRYDQFCGSIGFRANARSAMVTGAIVNSPGRDEILNAGGIILQTEPFQLS